MIKIGRELYERVGVVANHADKLGRSLLGTVKDYNQFVSSLETRLLVSARKLNDLDESQLAVDEIPTPKNIEATPTAISAAEAIESKADKNS
jgi:DNA recombination protein RmuC